MNPGDVVIVVSVTALLVLLCVGIHYEVFRLCGAFLTSLKLMGRPRVGLGILFALSAHLLEAFVFAVGLQFLIRSGLGQIHGAAGHFSDAVYFSLVTYSSLGIGDLYVTGPMRFMAGIEAITGLVLIAWTASFTFYEMQRFWRDKP
jgi:hypothetical protein